MNFELGKTYIVDVTEKGIIPLIEFDRSKWYNKDHDDLDFLTDEEKIVVINDVLDKIRAEIEQNAYPIVHGVNNHEKGMTLHGILQVIDKYKAESEDNAADNIFENLTDEEQNNMYVIFNKDKIKAKIAQWTKEAEEAGMALTEYLESISPLNDKKKLSWLGKSCKDCGNEKCKKLGTLPQGYDCALWQAKGEE